MCMHNAHFICLYNTTMCADGVVMHAFCITILRSCVCNVYAVHVRRTYALCKISQYLFCGAHSFTYLLQPNQTKSN